MEVIFDQQVAGVETIERLEAVGNSGGPAIICCTVATLSHLPSLPDAVAVVFKPFDIESILEAILDRLGVHPYPSLRQDEQHSVL
jgi:hypothetical protein